MNTSYGLQLYSLRDQIAGTNMPDTLKRTAAIGYKAVEFAGFGGLTAVELKAALEEAGLVAIGTHTGLDALAPEQIEETIAYHQTIGCTNLAVPYADTTTKEALDAVIDRLNAAQPILKEAGITLHYHNHNQEFLPNQDGQIPEEEMFKRTSVQFEIDAFWAYVAGKDPLEIIKTFGDRVSLVHLKDGRSDHTGTYLGKGEVPIAAIREYALANGISMIVESENQEPDGITEVTACFNYLKKLD